MKIKLFTMVIILAVFTACFAQKDKKHKVNKHKESKSKYLPNNQKQETSDPFYKNTLSIK